MCIQTGLYLYITWRKFWETDFSPTRNCIFDINVKNKDVNETLKDSLQKESIWWGK